MLVLRPGSPRGSPDFRHSPWFELAASHATASHAAARQVAASHAGRWPCTKKLSSLLDGMAHGDTEPRRGTRTREGCSAFSIEEGGPRCDEGLRGRSIFLGKDDIVRIVGDAL
ncbi:MAG: hypothetical protein RLY70_1677 [Planctomycetota bacterium]